MFGKGMGLVMKFRSCHLKCRAKAVELRREKGKQGLGLTPRAGKTIQREWLRVDHGLLGKFGSKRKRWFASQGV